MNMVKPIDLVAKYIRLRDQMQYADKEYAAFKKQHYDDPMKQIEDHFTTLFEETGSDSMKTRSGTVYRKVNVSVTTADGAALREYVIENGLWELVDWRPNKTQVKDLVTEGKPLPPGVNYSTHMSVHIQRPKE
jgi:hypothetical protein